MTAKTINLIPPFDPLTWNMIQEVIDNTPEIKNKGICAEFCLAGSARPKDFLDALKDNTITNDDLTEPKSNDFMVEAMEEAYK